MSLYAFLFSHDPLLVQRRATCHSYVFALSLPGACPSVSPGTTGGGVYEIEVGGKDMHIGATEGHCL